MNEHGQTIWKTAPLAVAIYVLIGIPISMFDYDITVFLIHHDIPSFSRFMDRSLFAGNAFGFSDIFTLVLIFLSVCYFFREFYGASKKLSKLVIFNQWELGYITAATLFIIAVVHTMKYTIGRARPYIVLAEGSFHQFTPWWRFGDHMPTKELFYSGSLPSGHCATVVASLSIVFVLDRRKSKLARPLGMTIIGLSLLMAVSRSMSRHHWISDSYIGFGVVWMILQYTFNHVDWHSMPRRSCEELRHLKGPILAVILLGAIVVVTKIFTIHP